MNYVGVDYHKRYSYVTAIDEAGRMTGARRVDNTVGDFRSFFETLDGPIAAVVEASRTWGVMYDLLEGLDGMESVTLAHPQKVRAIAAAKIKTDKIDAETLAQLLRVNLIPAAHIPGRETRAFKEMIRQRVFLVRLRTRLKNRIHVLLDRRRIPGPSVSDLFGKRGTDYLRQLKLSGVDGEILRENLHLLETLNQLIKEAERDIQRLIGDDPRVTVLRTVPGLGPTLAAVVAMEIDDIRRFATAAKLASYAGLVPSTYGSGGKVYHGRLLPMRNKWLRWAFVEAAWVAMRSSPYCKTFFEVRKRNKGPHTAAIALARRLSEIVWHVLTDGRAYEERPVPARRTRMKKRATPAALAAT